MIVPTWPDYTELSPSSRSLYTKLDGNIYGVGVFRFSGQYKITVTKYYGRLGASEVIWTKKIEGKDVQQAHHVMNHLPETLMETVL